MLKVNPRNNYKYDGGVIVFSSTLTTPGVWQDLDLSNYVGANPAIVFLEFTGATDLQLYFKPKGYGGTFGQHALYDFQGGLGLIRFTTGTTYSYTIMQTDANGVIEIAGSSNTVGVNIKLLSHIF